MKDTRKFLVIAVPFTVIGLVLGIGIRSTLWNSPAHQQEPHILLTVPDVRQGTDYSCGASALQAVLAYWGIDVREIALIKALGSDPQNGTRPEAIIQVARNYGLRAEMREGMEIPELRKAWQNQIPVIVDIQAWPDNPQTRPAWENDWEDGHYVVVIGIDDRNIYVEDPSLLGSRGVIPQPEFLHRWHDYEGDPPYDPKKDRAYVHLGLFIEGAKRSDASTFTPVR